MPAIVPNTGAPIQLPAISNAFAPQFAMPQWHPADFEGAYQFGYRGPDPTATANGIVGSFQNGEKMGLEQAKYNDGAPLRKVANDYATQEDQDFQSQRAVGIAQGGPLSNIGSGNLSDRPFDLPSAPLAGVTGIGSDVNLGNGTGAALSPATTEPKAFSNASAPDDDGFHMALGTTFAGQKDVSRYNAAKASGSTELQALAVGDNGLGKWGDATSGATPFVALPPSTLRAYGLDPANARGQLVEVQANGKSTVARVGDVMPDNSKNGAGIDLNPGAASSLGISDPDNFKGNVKFRLLSGDGGSTPAAVGSQVSLGAAPAPVNAAPNYNLPSTLAPVSSTPSPLPLANGVPGAVPTAALPARPMINFPRAVPPVNPTPLAGLSAPGAQTAAATPQPLAQGFTPIPGTLQDTLTNLHGPVGVHVGGDGSVSFTQPTPMSPAEAQFKQAQVDLDKARQANEERLANKRQTVVVNQMGADGTPQQALVDTATGEIIQSFGAKGLLSRD